jgi:hypothetical protein
MNDTSDAGRFQYEELVLNWDSALTDARRANNVFDELHALSTELKQTTEGRRILESLLAHENRAVRLNAGSTCLEWAPELARPVIQALVTPRGPHSLSAEMTLREFEAGRLKFDW